MIVLHVITSLESGGAQRILVRLAQENPQIRMVVVSLIDDGLHGPALREAGVDVYSLGMTGARSFPVALFRLIRLLRRHRPGVVMSWLYHADLIATLAVFLLGRRVPLIWNVRGSEMEFERYAPTTRWIVRWLSRLSPLPQVIGFNSWAGKKAHEALGYRARQWVYLPNGFNPDEWRPDPHDRVAVRQFWDIGDDRLVIIMVARNDPQKDYETFFAAARLVASRFPQVFFVVVGQGTEALVLPGELRDRCLVLGERSDVQRLLRGADLAVLSSAYGEGCPNALGEAMATGLPCVGTDVGDTARLIGACGRVVAPRQPAALAAALADLISLAPDARQALGQAARARILDAWTQAAAAQVYGDLFAALTQTPRR